MRGTPVALMLIAFGFIALFGVMKLSKWFLTGAFRNFERRGEIEYVIYE